MKMNIHRLAALLLFSAFSPQPCTLLAQGTLTPSGPPAPTMKTLAQIEPRTPISSAPFTITTPGAYYLTTNLTVSGGDAIIIVAAGVTLDLNGFTISSTSPSATGYGIRVSIGTRNIAILNGFIQGGVTNNGSGVYSGSGFVEGINSVLAPNVRVFGVGVSGCQNDGIYLGIGEATAVESCTVRTVGSYGIVASTIKNSSVFDCGSIAIFGDLVSDCEGRSTGSGYGIYATTAQNCYGTSASSYGVYATTAENCYGFSGSGYGVYASTAQNCYGYSTSSYGLGAITALNCSGDSSGSVPSLTAITAQNCYGSARNNGIGLQADMAQNCYGVSNGGTGLSALTAQNCYGSSTSGTGLLAYDAATCSGYSRTGTGLRSYNTAIGCSGLADSGTGLIANIANTCHAASNSGTAHSIFFRYNMP